MIYGSVYDSIHESTLLDVAPYEFDESMSFQEMGAQMIEEATNDWNSYMQAIALTELSYVIEAGQEYIYEGADISAMIDKVKEWFKKLWAKIQGIAKAAMAKFAQFAMTDEKFLSKYEKDIYDGEKKIPNGFSYKGYKFEGLAGKSGEIAKASGEVVKSADAAAGRMEGRHDAGAAYKTKDGKEYNSSKRLDEKLDMYRAKLAGKSGKVSASEFKKAVKIDLYGSADKEYIKTVNASTLVGIIKGAKDAQTAAKDAESNIKDSIDEKIDILDTLESKIRDAADATEPDKADDRDRHQGWASMVNRYSSYLKSIESINAQWFSMYITALKDQNRQAKAVCTKLISYANGVGAKKESAGMTGSLLEDRFAALDF